MMMRLRRRLFFDKVYAETMALHVYFGLLIFGSGISAGRKRRFNFCYCDISAISEISKDGNFRA